MNSGIVLRKRKLLILGVRVNVFRLAMPDIACISCHVMSVRSLITAKILFVQIADTERERKIVCTTIKAPSSQADTTFIHCL